MMERWNCRWNYYYVRNFGNYKESCQENQENPTKAGKVKILKNHPYNPAHRKNTEKYLLRMKFEATENVSKSLKLDLKLLK